jgi:hypothetical protein
MMAHDGNVPNGAPDSFQDSVAWQDMSRDNVSGFGSGLCPSCWWPVNEASDRGSSLRCSSCSVAFHKVSSSTLVTEYLFVIERPELTKSRQFCLTPEECSVASKASRESCWTCTSCLSKDLKPVGVAFFPVQPRAQKLRFPEFRLPCVQLFGVECVRARLWPRTFYFRACAAPLSRAGRCATGCSD